MKTSIATNALVALMALLPYAAVAKKDSPHRIFRQTRSKAAKSSTSADVSSHLSYESGERFESKAAKAKSFKFPKAKASKSCLDDEYLADFDLMLDMHSLSMSLSMPPYSGKSGKASSAKCSKYDSSASMHGDVSTKEAEFADDEWDDDYYFYSYNEDFVKEIIIWMMEIVSDCSGTENPLAFEDSCLVNSIIDVLAGSAFDETGASFAGRMLRGARKMQATEDFDDYYNYHCEVPDEADVEFVVDEAFQLCVEAGRDVAPKEHETVLDSLTEMFTNETCVCGMF